TDKTKCYRHGSKQVALDLLGEYQANDNGRQRTHHDIERKAAVVRTREKAGTHRYHALAVLPEYGQQGAQLDGDFKYLDLGAREVEQAARQNQMSRGRNRQEFGESFDNAHDQGIEGKR